MKIALADRKAYESLRVALSRQHQTAKLLLELTNDSLCGSFSASEGIGTFWLGEARKTNKPVSFKIIEEDDA